MNDDDDDDDVQIPESTDSALVQVIKSNSIYQDLITEKNEIEEKTKTDSKCFYDYPVTATDCSIVLTCRCF